MYNITIIVNDTLDYVHIFNELVKKGFNPYGKGRKISCTSLSKDEAWMVAKKGSRYWFW